MQQGTPVAPVSIRVGGAPAKLQVGGAGSTSIQIGARPQQSQQQQSQEATSSPLPPPLKKNVTSSSVSGGHPSGVTSQGQSSPPSASSSAVASPKFHHETASDNSGATPQQKTTRPAPPVGGLIGATMALGVSPEAHPHNYSHNAQHHGTTDDRGGGSSHRSATREHHHYHPSAAGGGDAGGRGAQFSPQIHSDRPPSFSGGSTSSNNAQHQHINKAGSIPFHSSNHTHNSGVGNGSITATPRSSDAGDDGQHSIYSSSHNSSNVSSRSSSHREELPLCKNDGNCQEVNQAKHQRQFAHTCRLTPCYHGSVRNHCRLFRHAPGQIVNSNGTTNAGGATGASASPSTPGTNNLDTGSAVGTNSSAGGSHRGSRRSRKKDKNLGALASVSFPTISENAPNAERICILHPDSTSNDIFGDWKNTKLHTFKRYLHQITGVLPAGQRLRALTEGRIEEMSDDLSEVSAYGVKAGSTVTVTTTSVSTPGASMTSPPMSPSKQGQYPLGGGPLNQLGGGSSGGKSGNSSFGATNSPGHLPSSADNNSFSTPPKDRGGGNHHHQPTTVLQQQQLGEDVLGTTPLVGGSPFGVSPRHHQHPQALHYGAAAPMPKQAVPRKKPAIDDL